VSRAPVISLVVAVAENGLIGRDGGLPWRIPGDLRHFKAVTMGKPIVMGRKTWESLGRPLPGRRNIVITRNADYRAEGAAVAHDLNAAIAVAGDAPEICVIGGAEIYAQALPRAHRLYLTEVHGAPAGDTFFPAFDRGAWREVSREAIKADEKASHDASIVVLEKK
jgi:dihydrofolate reductase